MLYAPCVYMSVFIPSIYFHLIVNRDQFVPIERLLIHGWIQSHTHRPAGFVLVFLALLCCKQCCCMGVVQRQHFLSLLDCAPQRVIRLTIIHQSYNWPFSKRDRQYPVNLLASSQYSHKRTNWEKGKRFNIFSQTSITIWNVGPQVHMYRHAEPVNCWPFRSPLSLLSSSSLHCYVLPFHTSSCDRFVFPSSQPSPLSV